MSGRSKVVLSSGTRPRPGKAVGRLLERGAQVSIYQETRAGRRALQPRRLLRDTADPSKTSEMLQCHYLPPEASGF